MSDVWKNRDKVNYTVDLKVLLTLIASSMNDFAPDFDFVCQVVECFNHPNVIDSTFLKQFIFEKVCQQNSLNVKIAYMKKSIEFLYSEKNAISVKSLLLRMVVLPLLSYHYIHNPKTDLVTPKLVDMIHSQIWVPLLNKSPKLSTDDHFLVGIMQLTTFIVQHTPQHLNEAKKDIIKYAWNQIQADDITCKHSAYVLLARFVESFDTPSKIVIQIYVSLLKAHVAEGRLLVKQALDILVPVLPIRAQESTDKKIPTWIRWTRKIIIEEGQNIAQLTLIYQMMVRHADLFYPYRDYFLLQMVASFAKLGLSPNSSADTKQLTLDLANMLFSWESKSESSQQGKIPVNVR